jgi:hypothetical protein
MTQRYAYIALVLSLALVPGGPSVLHAQEEFPYTLEQLTRLVESGAFPDERILELTRESCLGFRLDREAIRRLRSAGASEELIQRLGSVCVRLTTVVVTPAELEIAAGASGILRAQALLDPDNTPLPNVVFQWSSEDTTVADVSAGIVLGRMPGETRITVRTEEGQSGSALVRVTQALPGEAAAVPDSLAETGGTGKSIATAAGLGLAVPGGGEFYTGRTAKGVVVLLGVAAGLAAGYLITSEDTLGESRTPSPPDCDLLQGSCEINTRNELEIKETRNILVGAAIAGAFWLYGLIDGIRAAGEPRAAPLEEPNAERPGLSLELMPADGVRFMWNGGLELTFVRIRS